MKINPNWKQHVDKQGQSGLTISAYCKKEGLNQKTFSGWRKKAQYATNNDKEAITNGFVKIQSTSNTLQSFPQVDTAIEVKIGKSLSIVSQRWPSAEVLKQYLQVLT